jgi:hypothetical protein
MNKNTQKHIEELSSTNDKIRLDALQSTLKLTESKVDWVYEVWELLLEKLEDENSYQRSIGIMLLCIWQRATSKTALRTRLTACSSTPMMKSSSRQGSASKTSGK